VAWLQGILWYMQISKGKRERGKVRKRHTHPQSTVTIIIIDLAAVFKGSIYYRNQYLMKLERNTYAFP